MKKTVRKLLITCLLGSAWLYAAPALDTLARQESQLSAKLKQAYLRGGDPVPYYNRLIRVHRKLRQHTRSGEMRNMAVFLGFCLQDLRQALTAPRNRANAEIVADLDRAIQEGTGYLRRLSAGSLSLAAR